jgi:chromosome segregation ATPase
VINFETSKLKKHNALLSSKVKELEYDLMDYREDAEKKSKELTAIKAYCKEIELTINENTGEDSSCLQGTITSLRQEVTRLTSELDASTNYMTSKNQSLEHEVISKSEEITSLKAEISRLKTNIQDLQEYVVAERGPRLDALRQLEVELREKEEQISKQLIETKNASDEVVQAEAKVVSLKVSIDVSTRCHILWSSNNCSS